MNFMPSNLTCENSQKQFIFRNVPLLFQTDDFVPFGVSFRNNVNEDYGLIQGKNFSNQLAVLLIIIINLKQAYIKTF